MQESQRVVFCTNTLELHSQLPWKHPWFYLASPHYRHSVV